MVIEEVGLREGLQSNSKLLSIVEKSNIVEKLIEAGIKRIELGSFVNPRKVPQMEGIEELFKIFNNTKEVEFSALALNLKGVYRAIDSGVKILNVSISASNSHQKENTGKTIPESLDELLTMIETGYKNNISIYAGIQAVFGCYIEGQIPLERVQKIAKILIDTNKIDGLRLSDTAGFATPGQIIEVIDKINSIASNIPIILHLHDTFGMGLVNILAAINKGVYFFDSSIAGVGGCPFMKNAPGNISTEDLVFMLQSLGYLKEINFRKLCACANHISTIYQQQFSGRICNYIKILNQLNLYEA
ncbi:hydroxymethylglutaryl-CoA lyase [Desulfurella sp.]|uniref:hydroxymethylglutaryl-CoA lyase n=1 Tax=Desulfurella sp. TaxID=1962857 RepID=UPI0025B97C69|nr:hydroxymethylglutaryl-CoA lyase [Desulfurella sp.]